MKQIEATLRQRLDREFDPHFCEVVNESHQHNVPANSETHFKVTLVAASFVILRQVQRHQRVYRLFSDLMAEPIHALALHTFTPDEWAAKGIVPASPNCLGGE